MSDDAKQPEIDIHKIVLPLLRGTTVRDAKRHARTGEMLRENGRFVVGERPVAKADIIGVRALADGRYSVTLTDGQRVEVGR